MNSSTVRQYVNQDHIGCGLLKRGLHGTSAYNVTHPILLRAYITHCNNIHANGRKEPNLKDIITFTKVAMNTEKKSTFTSFAQNRLCYNAAVKFKTSKHYYQEYCQNFWTTFSNINTWFDSFENNWIKLGFSQHKVNGYIWFIHTERISTLMRKCISWWE